MRGEAAAVAVDVEVGHLQAPRAGAQANGARGCRIVTIGSPSCSTCRRSTGRGRLPAPAAGKGSAQHVGTQVGESSNGAVAARQVRRAPSIASATQPRRSGPSSGRNADPGSPRRHRTRSAPSRSSPARSARSPGRVAAASRHARRAAPAARTPGLRRPRQVSTVPAGRATTCRSSRSRPPMADSSQYSNAATPIASSRVPMPLRRGDPPPALLAQHAQFGDARLALRAGGVGRQRIQPVAAIAVVAFAPAHRSAPIAKCRVNGESGDFSPRAMSIHWTHRRARAHADADAGVHVGRLPSNAAAVDEHRGAHGPLK